MSPIRWGPASTPIHTDYGGDDTHHTKNGTTIDIADIWGIQNFDPAGEALGREGKLGFEAGWAADGAVCVARTRWPEIVTLTALLARYRKLAGPCDRAAAQTRGALMFTRVVER